MGGSLVLSVSVYFISACRSSSFNCRGGDNSQTEDVLKVNVADLETVTGSGGFFHLLPTWTYAAVQLKSRRVPGELSLRGGDP